MTKIKNPFIRTELVRTTCSINEAAYLIGCHRNTILNRFKAGVFTRIQPCVGGEIHLNLVEIKRYLAGEVPILRKDTILVQSNVSKSKKKKTARKLVPKNINNKASSVKPMRKKRKKVHREALDLEIVSKDIKTVGAKINVNSQNDKARDAISESFKKHNNQDFFNLDTSIKKTSAQSKVAKCSRRIPARFRETSTNYDFVNNHKKAEKNRARSQLIRATVRGSK